MEEYNAIKVAQHIIRFYEEKGERISNLKLQKLLYFAWIEFYKKKKKILFRQRIEAWKFGPVVPEVYYKYSDFGGFPIYTSIFHDCKSNVDFDDEDLKVIDDISLKYLKTDVFEMVSETHKEGGAWSLVFESDKKKEIPFMLIIDKECEKV